MQHLLTHVSWSLPDQLPENDALRKPQAGLPEFVEHAIRTPLSFTPGSRFQYSSMAILLAAHVAQKISGVKILEFVDRTVFQPLEMKHSALGIGQFALENMVACQTELRFAVHPHRRQLPTILYRQGAKDAKDEKGKTEARHGKILRGGRLTRRPYRHRCANPR
jgi:CubicO group peptidase (beta-lactamase class C family)